MNTNPCQYTTDIFTLHSNMTTCSASTNFLESIFGTPIDVLTGKGSMSDPVTSLLTLFLGHFDTLGLSLIIALFSYVVFHGFISTVNEGKFGGRDMGHWSYALRAILPGAMLVPVKGGFCGIQFVIMYFILVGVNLANYVWQQAVETDIGGGNLPTTPSVITKALAENLSRDMVLQAVSNIANTNNFNNPLPIGQVSVWDSSYANQVASQLTKACNQFAPNTPYTAICLNDLKQMQTYKTGDVFQPMGGYGVGEESSAPLSSVSIFVQTKNGIGNPMIPTGGTYTIKQLPTPAAGSLLASAIGTNGQLNSQIALITGGTPIKCGGSSQGTPGQTDACSLTPAISVLKKELITRNAPSPESLAESDVAIGTGDTCKATCRVLNSNAPVPGITTSEACNGSSSKPGLMGLNQSNNIWTTGCYAKNMDPSSSTVRYTYIPAQHIGDSWWYASHAYLQLEQAMAKNINKLASAVQTLNISDNDLLGFNADSTTPSVNFTIAGYQKTFTANALSEANAQITLDSSHPAKTITMSFNPLPKNTNASVDALNTIPWGKLIAWYTSERQAGQTASQYLKKIMGNNYQSKGFSIAAPNQSPTVNFVPSGFPQWFASDLYNMPAQYQNAVKLLLLMNMLPNSKGVTLTPTQLENYVANIVSILKDNGIFPGSAKSPTLAGVSTGSETTPVNTWINKVFSNLMGTNHEFAGTGANPGIFSQIYSLGNMDITNLNEAVSASFNTMANAQKIGLHMINVVTNSLTETYTNINEQLDGDKKADFRFGVASAAGAMSLGAIPFVGGALASAAATVTQTALQFTMADQMLAIGKEMAWMPIAVMVLTSMFTSGISFAVILPLTPFFLFWAGEIAWVLAVVEAMIAAPLLALGFTTPGGHQHFGHAIPGLKMLLAVVFRPVLMVLGLLSGMVLTFVVISFSSKGFQLVSEQILSFAGQNSAVTPGSSVPLAQGIVACLLLFTFCSFMMMAFTKCFSMIYVVPEKVMQWIGGMADKAGQQELEKMTQGMQQTSQSGAQSGGQTGEKSIGAQQQNAQSKGQADGSAIGGGGQAGGALNKPITAAATPKAPTPDENGLKT